MGFDQYESAYIFGKLFLKSLNDKHFYGRFQGFLKWNRHCGDCQRYKRTALEYPNFEKCCWKQHIRVYCIFTLPLQPEIRLYICKRQHVTCIWLNIISMANSSKRAESQGQFKHTISLSLTRGAQCIWTRGNHFQAPM